jgi:hypothetical protein
MNCQLCCQELSAYIDKELNEKTAAQLRMHLATCLNCKAEYESLLKIQVLMDEAEVFEPDSSIWMRVEQQISRKKADFWDRVLSTFQDLIARYAYFIHTPTLVGSLAAILLILMTFSLYDKYQEKRALMAWVEKHSPASVSLEINPFGSQVIESLDENPFDTFKEVSLDLNVNYFGSSFPSESETLEKNPFSL